MSFTGVLISRLQHPQNHRPCGAACVLPNLFSAKGQMAIVAHTWETFNHDDYSKVPGQLLYIAQKEL